MAATAKTPQFSVKLGWNKELKRNDRVILRVALHRIPVAHINVDVQKDRVRVDTLKNTRKFVLEYDSLPLVVARATTGGGAARICLPADGCRPQDPISCRRER